MAPWNRGFVLETILFRFHVKFVEGKSHRNFHPFSPWKISSANPRDFFWTFFFTAFCHRKTRHLKLVRKIDSEGTEETSRRGNPRFSRGENVGNMGKTTEMSAVCLFFPGIYGFQGMSDNSRTMTKRQLTKKLYPIFLYWLFHRDFYNGL